MKKLLLVFLCLNLYAKGLTYLNQLRQQVGEIPLKENKVLDIAAKNHSTYMFLNNIPSHYEKKGDRYFTGVYPYQRAIYAGYYSKGILENFSYGQNNIKDSIDSLFSAIYHRFGFLDTSINEIGIGIKGKFYTYDMGNSYLNSLCKKNKSFIGYGKYYINVCKNKNLKIKFETYNNGINILRKQNPKIIIWPPKNSKNILPAFYEEEPDPLPDYGVSGYPISVIFNPYYFKNKNIKIYRFRLFQGNREIKHTRLITKQNDVNHKFTKYQFALFPLDRLSYNTTYTAICEYLLDGYIYTLKWNFTTQKLNAKKFIIKDDKQTVVINENQKYIFYFPPSNSNDKIETYRVSYYSNQKLNTKLLDFNTLSVSVKGAGTIKFYLSNHKTLTLIVK